MKQEKENQANHEWDSSGERCWKCGDKDWMADKFCSESNVNKENYDKLLKGN